MKRSAVCCLLSILVWALPARAGEAPTISFSGRLYDLAFGAPDCGTMQFDTLAVYDQVEGPGLPGKVYVVHACIELARNRYAGAAGKLQKFVIGERHRLVVSKTAPARPGALVRGDLDPGDQPVYYARKTDLLIATDVTPRSIGGLELGKPDSFPAGIRDAAKAVGKSAGKPREFYAQIELKRATNELVFHLWHQDAFLPENKNMVGNPGGKCRDVYYHRETKRVTRTLFWQ